MKLAAVVVFLLVSGVAFGQDPWKNIYSPHAWAARDNWQRAEDLIRLMGVSAGSAVADVGCHEGYMTFKLARVVGRRGMVYAVDVEQGKLDKVKKRAAENDITQIKIVKGEYDDPKLPGKALDAVIILDTYHEMDDHDDILRHIRTALKDGGRLVICEPIADSRRGLSRNEQERRHELEMKYALEDLARAGYTISFQWDNYIDRTAEKGDKMWVVVATPAK